MPPKVKVIKNVEAHKTCCESRLVLVRSCFYICLANIAGNIAVWVAETSESNQVEWAPGDADKCSALWNYMLQWSGLLLFVCILFFPFVLPTRLLAKKCVREGSAPNVILTVPTAIFAVPIFLIFLAAIYGILPSMDSNSIICRDYSPNSYNAATLNVCVGSTCALGFLISFMSCIKMN
jgi:hypothetical protein